MIGRQDCRRDVIWFCAPDADIMSDRHSLDSVPPSLVGPVNGCVPADVGVGTLASRTGSSRLATGRANVTAGVMLKIWPLETCEERATKGFRIIYQGANAGTPPSHRAGNVIPRLGGCRVIQSLAGTCVPCRHQRVAQTVDLRFQARIERPAAIEVDEAAAQFDLIGGNPGDLGGSGQ